MPMATFSSAPHEVSRAGAPPPPHPAFFLQGHMLGFAPRAVFTCRSWRLPAPRATAPSVSASWELLGNKPNRSVILGGVPSPRRPSCGTMPPSAGGCPNVDARVSSQPGQCVAMCALTC